MFPVIRRSLLTHWTTNLATAPAVSRLNSTIALHKNGIREEPRITCSSAFITPNSPFTIQIRSFGKKKGKSNDPRQSKEDSDDEDSDDELEDIEVVKGGYTESTAVVASLRLDVVLKTVTTFGRNKVEVAFYEGRIRVNGEKPPKKGMELAVADTIDLILGRNADNDENLDVSRVEIADVPDIASQTGRLKLKVRKYKKLTIANYEKDPYDGAVISTTTDDDK